MSWLDRLEEKISEKRPSAQVAKGAKPPLATLATAGYGRFQKNNSSEIPLRVYRYRLVDSTSDLVLIAPGTSLDEAREGLRRRFGKRLLDVLDYKPGVKA